MIYVINFPDATGGVFFSQIFEDTVKNIDSLYVVKPPVEEYMKGSVKTKHGYSYFRRSYQEACDAYVNDVINDVKTLRAGLVITSMDYIMTKKLINSNLENCGVINIIPGDPDVSGLFIDKVIRSGIIEISEIPDFIPSIPSGINAARVELIDRQVKLIRDIELDSSTTVFSYNVDPTNLSRKIGIEDVLVWVNFIDENKFFDNCAKD